METSNTKDRILALIESQLSEIIEDYETQIREFKNVNTSLNQQILSLREEVRSISIENNELKLLITNREKVEQMEPIPQVNKNINKPSSIEKKSNFLQSEDTLVGLSAFNTNLNKEELELLTKYLIGLFEFRTNDVQDLDTIYKTVLSIIKRYSHLKEIKNFLRTNVKRITDQILDTNNPNFISELASVFFHFNMNDLLLSYFERVIKKWEYIDSNIELNDFYRLLWFAFYLNKDRRLLKKVEASSAYLTQPKTDIILYNLFKNILNGTNVSSSELKKVESYQKQVISLDSFEKEKLFNSLNKRIKKLEKETIHISPNQNQRDKINTNRATRKIMYVTKISGNEYIIPTTNKELTEEWIQLKVFKDTFSRKEDGYVLVKALSVSKEGKVYVTNNLYKDIRKKVGNKWLDVREYNGENKIEKRSGKEVLKHKVFSWPSTELSDNKSSISMDDKSLLNEESDLKKLGYQITGKSRENRWRILEIAVKQIGLRKVAYTIAQHVKLRKGQKNGTKKFSYAIGEWEYDLAKLKSRYYKSNFTWPTTNIK
ncbi:hypothetical protein [Rossellomorea sp. KS-H15a]|uniref:hypothetical protein n=1 Tax=Rossellomorea sp. KS-H15a TaxID=2963940 RepID=UPI0020C67544|nr:hypothetical protein [Rossellomorea sp. KS-H15a]UTE78491.1 hypothetical protein M1J35_06910 [Rossellomorea sp. KS-H15a]